MTQRALAPISVENGLTVCARDHEGRLLARLDYGTEEEAARAFHDLRGRILNAVDETALCIATDEWVKAEQKRAEGSPRNAGRRSFLDRYLDRKDEENDGDFL